MSHKPQPATAAVLGAGAFGLALADHLSRNGLLVRVWDRSDEVLAQLRATGTINRPAGLVLGPTVSYWDTIVEAVDGAEIILSAVPSFATADICEALAPVQWPSPGAIFVNCSKGIEPDTLRFPCQVFHDVIGKRTDLRYAVLAGPSHAEEVSRSVPTAVVASAADDADARRLQALFRSQTFRVYLQPDFMAVEIGGALKNVMAIAAGISDGTGFGDNTKAALITRGLAEISRLAVSMGSSPEAVTGLSGLGDLIVTTMSRHSRNRGFGDLLAQGLSPEQALEKIGAVVEGYLTAKSAYGLATRHGVEMPLVQMVYQILYNGQPISDAINQLLERDPAAERD